MKVHERLNQSVALFTDPVPMSIAPTPAVATSVVAPYDEPLASWEHLVVDAVGNVIEFWGFKRNQGRVWALLYLRDVELSASQIQRALSLSKGGVSNLTRELESWDVIGRTQRPGDSTTRFRANCDLPQMIRNVLRQREATFLASVRADLAAAERVAHADPKVPREMVERVTRMRRLAELVERTLGTFLKTAQFDLSGLVDILQTSVRRAGARRSS
jgi:DNA-binding transcriptional regulator GbsR (MarR family)